MKKFRDIPLYKLYPDVTEAQLNKIGQAFLVVNEYPEIFGDVPMGKFVAMFMTDEQERRARNYERKHGIRN